MVWERIGEITFIEVLALTFVFTIVQVFFAILVVFYVKFKISEFRKNKRLLKPKMVYYIKVNIYWRNYYKRIHILEIRKSLLYPHIFVIIDLFN